MMPQSRPAFPDFSDHSSATPTEYFRSQLQEVVTLHTMMFDKLLFEGQELPLELAELFEDVANTYLTFSEKISNEYLSRRT